jgi:hypothetical protein
MTFLRSDILGRPKKPSHGTDDVKNISMPEKEIGFKRFAEESS